MRFRFRRGLVLSVDQTTAQPVRQVGAGSMFRVPVRANSGEGGRRSITCWQNADPVPIVIRQRASHFRQES